MADKTTDTKPEAAKRNDLVLIGAGHTHVRCQAISNIPRAHMGHRVAFFDAGGAEVGDVSKAPHLTYCSAPRVQPEPGQPAVPQTEFADPREQDVRIPAGAASYAIVDAQASEGASVHIDSQTLRIR